jgi:hypothetical protein
VLERLRVGDQGPAAAYGELGPQDQKKLALSLRFPLRLRFPLNTVLLTGALLLLALPLLRPKAPGAAPLGQVAQPQPTEQMLGWEDGFITERIDKIGSEISRLEASM